MPVTGVAMAVPRMYADVWATLGVAGLQYWTRVLARPDWPVRTAADSIRWTTEWMRCGQTQWATPNRVRTHGRVARLREFRIGTTSRSSNGTPTGPRTLIVAPQVASDSCLVDLTARTSQVRLAAAAGLGRVFALEWTPTTEASDASVEDYVAAIDDAITVAGGPVHLVGNSMGGWLSVVYTALRPEHVASLTVIGSPVDFHAGAFPPPPLEHISAVATARAHELMVKLHRGAVPGRYLLAGLVAAHPEDAVRHSAQLLLGLRDPQTIDDHRRLMAWYHSVRPFPGALYRWIVRNLYERNALIRGELSVGGSTVDLSRISCPVTLLAGDQDRVAPLAGLRPLMGAVSTPSAKIRCSTARGGHLDLFTSPTLAQGPMREMFEHVARTV